MTSPSAYRPRVTAPHLSPISSAISLASCLLELPPTTFFVAIPRGGGRDGGWEGGMYGFFRCLPQVAYPQLLVGAFRRLPQLRYPQLLVGATYPPPPFFPIPRGGREGGRAAGCSFALCLNKHVHKSGIDKRSLGAQLRRSKVVHHVGMCPHMESAIPLNGQACPPCSLVNNQSIFLRSLWRQAPPTQQTTFGTDGT